MLQYRTVVFALLSVALLTSACKKSSTEDPAASFDKGPLLQNVANNIIVPNYQKLSVDVNKLDSAANAFTTAPDATSLSNLQDLFKAAYRTWQYCSVYEFGPADVIHLRSNMNTYPTTVAQINSNIASGSYSLDAAINLSAKGFPALDYLLFGTGADNTAILDQYNAASDAAQRKQYLTDLTADMKTKVNTTLNGWLASGDNYLATFVSSTGSDIGSSISLLVNQYVVDYENLKNYKIAIPLGIQSAGVAYPEKVEAYYSGISKELALLQLQASEELYLGKSGAVDSIGFDDFLIQVGSTSSDGAPLDPQIKGQYTAAISKLQDVADPLSNSISVSPSTVNLAYIELQKQVNLIKREMPPDMGVLLAFSDSDGD